MDGHHVATLASGLEGVAGWECPLCGGNGRPTLEFGSAARIRYCDCEGDVILSFPFGSVEEYERQYETGAYHEEEMLRSHRQVFVQRDAEYLQAALCRLDLIRQVIPEGRLLDVGAGTGALVAQAQATGYQAVGWEPSRPMVKWAQAQGRPLQAGGWQQVQGMWEVITLCDVLEHLTSPRDCLDHLRNSLAPEGLLYVEFPEVGGDGWERHIKPREHLFLLSDAAAQYLFAKSGFRINALWRPLRGRIGKIAYFLEKR